LCLLLSAYYVGPFISDRIRRVVELILQTHRIEN
jgi:hypothetical protein